MIDEFLEAVYRIVPTQRKKVEAYFKAEPAAKADLGRFLEIYSPYMKQAGLSVQDLAEGYCGMVNEMLGSRLAFLREGSYPAKSQSKAFQEVYNNPATMRGYMLGSALSQFLWKAHYAMFSLYREVVAGLPPKSRMLEVGSGHGLFLYQSLKLAGEGSKVDVVDISDTSLAMTQGVIMAALPQALERVSFKKADFTVFQPEENYDFITMGEVLEHVEDALGMLKSIRRLLKPTGRSYISTCANCPAIDHVYEFHRTSEIRDLMAAAGLEIVREVEVASEDKPPEVLEKLKIDISYAAIVKPRS